MAAGSDDTLGPIDEDPFAIDPTHPEPARIQNYLAGGDSHFTADQRVAEEMGSALPGGVDTARAAVRTLGAFVGRAVRYLAGEAGIRQFLNIGVAVPTEKFVHRVAQQAASDARFVYVSDDPMVLAHAHDLRRSSPEGASDYIHGSLRDVAPVLHEAAGTLKFESPIAVILPTTLNFVPDDAAAAAAIAELMGAVVSGSYLVVVHASYDIPAEGMPEAADRLRAALDDRYRVRTKDEIARFFDGLAMVEPGLVPIEGWRSDPNAPSRSGDRPVPIYGGVALKR